MEETVMITCKEVATLLDTEELPRQSWWTQGSARLHLMMCRHCRLFERQLRQLRVGARAVGVAFDAEQKAPDLERRIATALGLEDRRPPQ